MEAHFYRPEMGKVVKRTADKIYIYSKKYRIEITTESVNIMRRDKPGFLIYDKQLDLKGWAT